MFPSALGVSTFAAEANPPGVGKAKGPDHSGPFYSSRLAEKQFRRGTSDAESQDQPEHLQVA